MAKHRAQQEERHLLHDSVLVNARPGNGQRSQEDAKPHAVRLVETNTLGKRRERWALCARYLRNREKCISDFVTAPLRD